MKTEPIRVWSAGCSTGEEAYSIAILFHEVLEELNAQRDIKIFATDVDTKAIEQAGKGVFSENILDDVSSERLAKYFSKKNEQYHISKEIRRMIIFAPHNMLSDPPFGKLDLISCRNVMIYFQPVLQKSLFAIFHSALKKGGLSVSSEKARLPESIPMYFRRCAERKKYMYIKEKEKRMSSGRLPLIYPTSRRFRSEDGQPAGSKQPEATCRRPPI